MPKFDNVYVQLVGQDGNAYSILARVARAIRLAGATPEQVEEYTKEATSGDYNHLLQTTLEWINEGSDPWDDDDDDDGDDWDDDDEWDNY
jgi:hypothetical protein